LAGSRGGASKNGPIADSVRKTVESQGSSPDPSRFLAAARPQIVAGRANVERARQELQAILTPVQWMKLPEQVRNPRAGPAGRPGGPPQGFERRPQP